MTEREVFTEALSRPDLAERAAFLDAVCAGDDSLRRRVDALLARHGRGDALLDRQPADLLAAVADPTQVGSAGVAPVDDAAGKLTGLLGPSDRPGALGRVGHYDVLEVRGRGGFGIVVRAFDTTLHRVVAIKFLDPVLAATSPPRQRFLREARTAARVNHEHVIRVYAVAEQPVPYLAMEYVDGQTLQDHLDAFGPLPPAEVVALGRQIALGLAAAHEQGLIHRDVKPANVLLDGSPERRARLTDFGLARAADDASLTQSGVIAGSPLYMSPEQAKGEVLDARADLFSLGSTMYTMAAGRPAFRAANPFAVLKRVAEDTPRPLREVMPGTPPGLIAVIDKLLSKRPDDRFATAREAADALAGCLTAPNAGSSVIPPSRRRTALLVATVALLIGAGLVAGMRLKPGDPDRTHYDMASPPRDTREETAASLPAQDPKAELLARLKQFNPKFRESTAWFRIEKGVIVELRILECHDLIDITPLRSLTGLKSIFLSGGGPSDISPLQGMKLERYESFGFPIRDLSPLAGMPLKTCNLWQIATDDLSALSGMRLEIANVGGSPVSDISVLRPMRLISLCLNNSQVRDLSPLEGHPLVKLECLRTKVTDLRPIANAPLEILTLEGSPIADYTVLQKLPLKHIRLDYQPHLHAELLRAIATLETINGLPARRFLDEGPAARPPAGTLVVTSALDDGRPGTLRWAIEQANILQGENTITFDPALFGIPQTITLERGPLLLTDSAMTTITGPAAGLTVSGDDKYHVFVIGASLDSGSPAVAAIEGLTIAHGRTPEGELLGGGVFCRGGSTLTLTGCTLRDNQALVNNGGGGGIFNHDSTVTLINCTFTRNRAYGGSGVKTYLGTTRIYNCTFADNRRDNHERGAVWNGGFSRTRTEIHNCLFADTELTSVISAHGEPGVSGDYNLSADHNVPGEHSLRKCAARLGPLGRHGGPTETFPLLTGSPAVDAGSNEAVPAGIRTDQRGRPRVGNSQVDIGAVEAD